MKIRIAVLVLLALVLGFARPATAGPNANAKILLNVRASSTHNLLLCSEPTGAPPNCSAINTSGKVTPVNTFGQYVYLLIADADGVGQMNCGINFTGIDPSFYSWYLCADADTTTNGWTSSGNLITWNTCQSGLIICAGYFYVGAYTPCQLQVVPDPADGLATVTDCSGNVDVASGHDVSHLGLVNFSVGAAIPGFNPCGLNTPVMNSSWSKIKATYTH